MAEIIQVQGLKELQQKLARLPADVSKKLLRKSVGTAAGNAKRDAQAAAPRRTGTLHRAALVKFDRQQSNATQAVFLVTFRKGKKLQKGAAIGKSGKVRRASADAFYASWVEFGHKIVPRSKRVARKGKLRNAATVRARRSAATGFVAGRRFLTNSFAANTQKHIQTIERVIRDGFESAVK